MRRSAWNNDRFACVAHRAALTALLVLLLSCEGSVGPEPKTGSGKGTVALFITDNISMYKQVVTTFTGVRLVDTARSSICTVLDQPTTLDIANLTNRAQYTALTECPEGNYNRIDIEIRKPVHLMDQLDAASACSYGSYFLSTGEQRSLVCDPVSGDCTFSIQGAGRGSSFPVYEDSANVLGIDFDLKQFTVAGFGDPAACSVTLQAAVVSAATLNNSGRAHGVTGSVQGLDAANGLFTLLSGGGTLTVDYRNINPALQPNIGTLLQTAQDGGLTVSVYTGSIDLATKTIAAERIYLNAAGTVSNVKDQPQWTFTLVTSASGTIDGSHKPPVKAQGAFLDGAWVNVKFDGYSAAKARFLASSIEVLPANTVLDD